MPKDAKVVTSGLKKKGFVLEEGDHHYFQLYVNGKKEPIYTKISHGEREIGDKLIGMMARQVGLNKRDFLDLVDCPLTLEDYLNLLRTAGKIDA
jgi:hypothetical protein